MLKIDIGGEQAVYLPIQDGQVLDLSNATFTRFKNEGYRSIVLCVQGAAVRTRSTVSGGGGGDVYRPPPPEGSDSGGSGDGGGTGGTGGGGGTGGNPEPTYYHAVNSGGSGGTSGTVQGHPGQHLILEVSDAGDYGDTTMYFSFWGSSGAAIPVHSVSQGMYTITDNGGSAQVKSGGGLAQIVVSPLPADGVVNYGVQVGESMMF